MVNLGGAASMRPAFVADAWNPHMASVLVARMMPVLLVSAFAGPRIMAHSREKAVTVAAENLAVHIDAATFEKAFHAPKEELAQLLQAKTVTLPQLELCGPGVIDPTPFLYTEGVGVLVLLQVAALSTNLALKPID